MVEVAGEDVIIFRKLWLNRSTYTQKKRVHLFGMWAREVVQTPLPPTPPFTEEAYTVLLTGHKSYPIASHMLATWVGTFLRGAHFEAMRKDIVKPRPDHPGEYGLAYETIVLMEAYFCAAMWEPRLDVALRAQTVINAPPSDLPPAVVHRWVLETARTTGSTAERYFRELCCGMWMPPSVFLKQESVSKTPDYYVPWNEAHALARQDRFEIRALACGYNSPYKALCMNTVSAELTDDEMSMMKTIAAIAVLCDLLLKEEFQLDVRPSCNVQPDICSLHNIYYHLESDTVYIRTNTTTLHRIHPATHIDVIVAWARIHPGLHNTQDAIHRMAQVVGTTTEDELAYLSGSAG